MVKEKNTTWLICHIVILPGFLEVRSKSAEWSTDGLFFKHLLLFANLPKAPASAVVSLELCLCPLCNWNVWLGNLIIVQIIKAYVVTCLRGKQKQCIVQS